MTPEEERELIATSIKKDLDRMYKEGTLKREERPPILYIEPSLAESKHIRELLKGADFPVIVLDSIQDVKNELKSRGMSDWEIQAKITGLAHDMRSDAELPSLAEVVRAMPAIVPKHEPKESKRPALPRNRKRDRWN